MNTLTIGDRIRKMRKDMGISQAALAKMVNVSSPAITQWENNDTQPKGDNLLKLSAVLGVTPQWLLNGEDGGTLVSNADFPPINEDKYVTVARFDIHGSCGSGTVVGDYLEVKSSLAFRRDWMTLKGYNAEKMAIGYGKGLSMWPTIGDGEALMFDLRDTVPKSGKIYILSIDNELLIKRLVNVVGKWIIRSDNPDKNTFPDIEVSPEALQHVRIHARVVWRAGDL